MDQSAIKFAEGDLLARAVNNSFAPLYRYFLGVLYWIFGRNLYIIYGIQFLMGAFSCVLLYWIGKELFGLRAGILAALGLAFYTTHIVYEGILLRAAFISFLGVVLFFLLLRISQHFSKSRLLFMTLALSLYIQARPNTILVLPIVCFFLHQKIFIKLRDQEKPLHWKLFVGVLLISFTPLLIQSFLVHKKFVFFDASGTHSFISGNVVDYSGVGLENEIVEKIQKENSLEYGDSIQFLFRHIFENPFSFLLLYIRKIYFFLNDFEAPSNISVYLYRQYSSVLPYLMNHFALLSSLGLMGMIFSSRKNPHRFLLFGFTLSLAAAIVIFHNNARYRLPIVPFMILFSACGMDKILKDIYQKKISLVCTSVLVFSVLFSGFQELNGLQRIRANDYGNTGKAYLALGKIGLAQDFFQKSLDIAPHNFYARINLGQIYGEQNRFEKAAIQLNYAIQLNPEPWQPYFNLGVIYTRINQWQLAEKFLMKAYRRNKSSPKVSFQLGKLYGSLGQHAQAIKYLEESTDLQLNQPKAWFLLGIEFEIIGKRLRAIVALEKTVNLQPGHAEAWNNLGVLYSHEHLYSKAQHAFQRALNADPDFQSAKMNLDSIRDMLPKR